MMGFILNEMQSSNSQMDVEKYSSNYKMRNTPCSSSNKLRTYKADLHVHTVLSPCADLLMTPGNIIKRALASGLDIIAITDHNSAENVEVTMELAKDTPLHVIPGMEVESSEEVHLLCLFNRVEDLLKWQEIVYNSLPDLKNDEDYFGYQLLMDLNDEYAARVDRLLAVATGMTVEEIVDKVTEMGGLVIPSHIDRPYNSIITNLGFIPPKLKFPLLEVYKGTNPQDLIKRFPYLKGYSFIKDSDSHYLDDLEPMMEFRIKKVNLEEILLAAREKDGRGIILKQVKR